MLSITNLNKSFGNFRALTDLTLSVNDGELFGFVGANGAGKTTTMKICVGLETATSGSVTIDDEQMLGSNSGTIKKKVGYVPDFFGVYNNLTAFEYLKFFAAAYDIWGKKSDILCEELLELVNLKDKKDSQVDSLSRGMKQRMCLARALVHNPKILFLDEPASGLDPKARHELKEILKNLVSMDKTIVISSHILPELIEMCSSIGIISHGQMKFNGSVEDALKLSTGTLKYDIILGGRVNDAASLIRETPHVTDCSITGNTIRISSSGTEEENSMLLKKLVMNDIPVYQYICSSQNAENIFLELMEGGIK